jgi:catechol-2,3-dioxygenase
MASFYCAVLGMSAQHQDADHQVLEWGDAQLIVHAIPRHIADTFQIRVPPELREEQAIKLFFTVASIDDAETLACRLGGGVCGAAHASAGMRSRNIFDPEGNIFSVREHTAT